MHILLLYVPPQFPRCVANSLKSQVDPQIRKTANSLVEALNVKKIRQPIREGRFPTQK